MNTFNCAKIRLRLTSGVGRCQTMGGGHTLKVYDRLRSDRARPKAVLGVDAGGGHPLPLGGPGVLPPGKVLGFYITVDDIWWILINQMWFCVQYLMTDTIQCQKRGGGQFCIACPPP